MIERRDEERGYKERKIGALGKKDKNKRERKKKGELTQAEAAQIP
jgi:hypothetical protein